MKDYQLRAIKERDELMEKVTSLINFINSDKFVEVNGIDRFLLIKQRDEMRSYLDTLEVRVRRFGGAKDDDWTGHFAG